MQYNEFEHNYLFEIIPNRKTYIRNGQSLMIYLAQVAPKLYKEITATEFDCFYLDTRIPLALKWLEENWSLNFEPISELLTRFCTEQCKKFPFLSFRFENETDSGYWFMEIDNKSDEKLPMEYIVDECNLRDIINENYHDSFLVGDLNDLLHFHDYTDNAIKIGFEETKEI